MKKIIYCTLLVCLLLFAGCQAETPVNVNPANNPAAIQEEEPQPPAPTKTPEPTPEPTETVIPSPQPTATLDPWKIHFATKGMERANLKGGGPVFSIAWHPDSSLFANSGVETILVWGVSSKNIAHAYKLKGHSRVTMDLDWAPDGSTLASLSLDETVRLWKAPEYQDATVLDTGKAFCMDWAPDSQLLAVGTSDGIIQIWDTQEGQIQATWQMENSNPVIQIDWSPDQTKVTTAHESGEVVVWDAASGSPIQILSDDQDSPVSDLAFAPDGSYLATSHANGRVHLWDPDSLEIVRTIEALEEAITKIAWSPDSLILATGGSKASVPLFEAASGELIRGIGMPNTVVWSLEWSPDGKILSIGTGGRGLLGPQGNLWGHGEGHRMEYDEDALKSNENAGVIYLWLRK